MTGAVIEEVRTVTNAGRVVCAAGKKPHRVLNDQGEPIAGFLCEHHFTDLGRILRDIEREASPWQITESGEVLLNLDPRPSMETRWTRHGGVLASEQSPVRGNVIAHRDHRLGTGTDETNDEAHAASMAWSALAVLHRWAEHVRRHRGLTRPTVTVRLGWVYSRRGPTCGVPCGHDTCGIWVTDTIRATPTIHSERDVLTRQLDWITRQDWAGDVYQDMWRLRNQLRRVNGTNPPDPLPGKCPVVTDKTECGGPLWPVKPKHTVGEWTGASPSAVACGSCKTRWEGPSALARLTLILETQGRKAS